MDDTGKDQRDCGEMAAIGSGSSLLSPLLGLAVIVMLSGFIWLMAMSVLGEDGEAVANQARALMANQIDEEIEVHSVLSTIGWTDPVIVKHTVSDADLATLTIGFHSMDSCRSGLFNLAELGGQTFDLIQSGESYVHPAETMAEATVADWVKELTTICESSQNLLQPVMIAYRPSLTAS